MTLKDLKNKNRTSTHLFLISKDKDKKLFSYKVDIDESLRSFFNSSFEVFLEKNKEKQIEQFDFDRSTDDSILEFIVSDSNELSFHSNTILKLPEVNKQFIGLKKLSETKQSLLAYVVKYFDSKKGDNVYSVTKIQPSKISVDKKKNIIRAAFSTDGSKLTEYNEESINFSKNIDFIVYDNSYLISNKAMFEQIVDISKLIETKANETISELETLDTITGVENIEKLTKGNRILQKRLIKLKYVGTYKNLDKEKLEKIKEVGNKHGIQVEIEKNRLVITDTEEYIENICKLLCDFYKIGEVSGTEYGTYSGEKLNI